MTPDLPPTLADIQAAAARIAPLAHRTPILSSTGLDELAGARLVFKCENFQRVGAFKFRGACNAVQQLSDDQLAQGVATHSSGNHAAALALAARLRGATAHIVMPAGAPPVKRAAVIALGGRVTTCPPTLVGREAALAEVVAATGATIIHPYNDHRVIAGQGTAALELLTEHPELDDLVAPVGGGGLLAGTALAAAGHHPRPRVLGAEPAGADDACRSLIAGRIVPQLDPRTIADGLRTSLGERTFPILQRHVAGIRLASEEGIRRALRLLLERLKVVVEPSAAVPLAAILEHPAEFAGRRVGIILSGGNLDLDAAPWRDPADGGQSVSAPAGSTFQ